MGSIKCLVLALYIVAAASQAQKYSDHPQLLQVEQGTALKTQNLSSPDSQLRDIVTCNCDIESVELTVESGTKNIPFNITNNAAYSKTSSNKYAYTTTFVSSGSCSHLVHGSMTPKTHNATVSAKASCFIQGPVSEDLLFAVSGSTYLEFSSTWSYKGECTGYVHIRVVESVSKHQDFAAKE